MHNFLRKTTLYVELVMDISNADFEFTGFVDVMDYFKRIIYLNK